jgi:hypothetical protein
MSAELPISECRLDLDGLNEQRGRYRRLGAQAEEVAREHRALTVRFGAGLDEALLRETISVEGGCCPFFRFEYSAEERLLTVGVARTEEAVALDALAFALGADDPKAPAAGTR